MVPPCSDRISRAPPYSNGGPFYGYGAVTHIAQLPNWFAFIRPHGLVRVRSPLLTESRLMSFPTGTEMFQFPAFALLTLYIQIKSTCVTRLMSALPHASANSKTTTTRYQVGFPIRKSMDQRVLSPPHGLSQSATSFIASYRQGIHQTPFMRLIRSSKRKTSYGLRSLSQS